MPNTTSPTLAASLSVTTKTAMPITTRTPAAQISRPRVCAPSENKVMKKPITNVEELLSNAGAALVSAMKASQVAMKAGIGWVRRQYRGSAAARASGMATGRSASS